MLMYKKLFDEVLFNTFFNEINFLKYYLLVIVAKA